METEGKKERGIEGYLMERESQRKSMIREREIKSERAIQRQDRETISAKEVKDISCPHPMAGGPAHP